MTTERGGFVRRNLFVLAAAVLPAVVVVFFLLASAIPRSTVPDPAYDLIFRAERPYSNTRPTTIAADIAVRGGRVEVTARRFDEKTYVQGWALFRFDHATGRAQEIALDLPSLAPGEEPRVVGVEALASLRLATDAVAPDGYQLQSRTAGGSGLVGELFGMGRRNRASIALVNRGRVVRVDLPAIAEGYYQPVAQSVAWIREPRS